LKLTPTKFNQIRVFVAYALGIYILGLALVIGYEMRTNPYDFVTCPHSMGSQYYTNHSDFDLDTSPSSPNLFDPVRDYCQNNPGKVSPWSKTANQSEAIAIGGILLVALTIVWGYWRDKK
jgi:hypothetical protein